MSTRAERRVLINTAVLGAGEAVGQLANFAFVVVLARRYGVEVFGWYSFAMALGAVLALFVSLGGVGYVTRELARDAVGAQAIFDSLRPLQLASGLIVWLLIVLVATLSDAAPGERWVIVIVGAYQILLKMTSLYLAPAAARQRPLAVAVVGGGHRVLVAILAGVAILLGLDAPVALLAMPVAALVALLVARAHTDRYAAAAEATVERLPVIRASLPFLGTGILAVIYSRGGLLLLTAMGGGIATGLFSAADRLLMPIYMVTAVFATALLPSLASLAGEPARMSELARRCLRLVLLVSIPLCALLAIFSREIVTLVFGPALGAAGTTLSLLAPLPVLRSVTTLWSTQCLAVNEEHRVAVAKTQATVVFLALATAGIALAGATGLAIACVASESYLAFRLRGMLARHSQYEPVFRIALRPVVAAVAAAAVATLVSSMGLPLRVLLVASALILTLALVGGVRAHDLRFLNQIVRR
jgi:O-antigen/teichoic acid export membrane protein